MENENVLAKGIIERIGMDGGPSTHSEAIDVLLGGLEDRVDAIGHRMVHGGEYFAGSVLVDDDVMNKVRDCIELAPLHNPANIAGIEACEAAMPDVPQVVVFDTAFHQTMPEKAYIYPIPRKMYEDYKVRRYGAHGTSHKYLVQRAAQLLGKPRESVKIITCHLGNGSSITAVKDGKSIDTSMGFTPLAGVMMGTRSGDIDPAIPMYLMGKTGMTASDISQLLNKESGLLAVSQVSSDFRDIWEKSDAGDKLATLALHMFVYQVKKFIGAYMAALNGADAIVFAGGVGENDTEVRRLALEDMSSLGIKIDGGKNAVRGEQIELTAAGSRVRVFVIPTNEELMIAAETAELLKKR
jgi:acetate kinase